ncbi:hypothetical protein [Methylophilus aquaticus]|uniref:Peptidylprolyl isomerase n=1 Tax=Methylophilus aquaticus TaxID=1971610 RepID=A0ABT9JRN2_9PROT|nr:hypothetical protein [Methylophilus aquaticus]MDP8567186.1 hypothetical protein [Methylophilus aquaticus]
MQNFLAAKTDGAFLDKLISAAKSEKTKEQLEEQRVSFIFSAVDKDQNITKAQIEKQLHCK